MNRYHTPQTALITGASDGIGLELAKIFAKAGYDLIIVADNHAKLQAAEQKIRNHASVDVRVITADLANLQSSGYIYSEVQKMGRTIDVLVNNAGVGVYGKFPETSLEDELSMIHLNICAAVQLTKLFVNDMMRGYGGKILFTSSIAGLGGSPYLSVYGATKAFIYMFAMGLREELEENNISVTTLLPSETDTNFFRRANMQNSKIAQGDLADPAVVAQEGFDALMKGKSHVGAPLKAKIFEAASGIMPESWKASMMKQQQKPVDA